MKALPFVLGAVGGGLAAWGVCHVFQSKLEASFAAGQADLQRQLAAGGASLTSRLTAGEQQAARTVLQLVQATVPGQVDAAIVTTLGQYGITPTVAQKIARIVNALP